MKQNLWKNRSYGDVWIENGEETLKLRKLFGIEMEGTADLPKRISGLFDVFTSLGNQANHEKIEQIEWQEDFFRADILLYEGQIRYTTEWNYEPSLGIIRRSDHLTNLSDAPVTLYRAMMRFVFAYDTWEAYTQNSRWCYENMGSWNPVTFGGVSLACEGGRTTQGATPFLALRNSRRKGTAFHLIPNGNWEMNFKTVSLGVGQAGEYGFVLETGQSDEHFALTLAPGERFDLPELLIQSLVGGELSLTAANLQRYFLKTDTGRFRMTHPVVYNSWFGNFALLDETVLKERVQTAKELGCEIFVIDSGWYGSRPGDWWGQTGDWSEKTDGAFYGKMREFADYVRSQGLGFGLWMEPERIGEITPIFKEHPEYFAKGNGFYYPKLYLPEVYSYVYSQISGLVDKYELAWMKMDFNFELGEDETFSEFYLYYQAWYRLLEELKKQYPNTFFEGCASGGLRNDIHTTMTYDGHFINDNVSSMDMQFTFEQCCLRMPHYRLIKWLVVNPGAKLPSDMTTADARVDTVITTQHPGAGWEEYERIDPAFACQLTMAGMVGLSGNFTDLTQEQRDVFREYITFYKKYRNFFKEAVLYLGKDPMNVGDKTGFYSLQYNKEETDEHLVFSYRFATAGSTDILCLHNMDEHAVYEIKDALTEEILTEMTGEELMHSGLEVCHPARRSGKIFLIQKRN